MENKKTAIGTYGYIDEMKQKSRTNMIVYFVFAVGLLVVSYFVMKTVLNAFTVAAVAMLIPAFQGWKQYRFPGYHTSHPELPCHQRRRAAGPQYTPRRR